MIQTETIYSIKKKLLAKEVDVSIGSILNLKLFLITLATEKEMSLCLCKICLHKKFLFDPLRERMRKDGDNAFDSISTVLNHGCDSPKSGNSYFRWACSTHWCLTCKNSKPATLKCQIYDDFVSVSQVEIVEREYSTRNKESTVVKKITKLTE